LCSRIRVMRACDLLPLGHLVAPWSYWLANSVEARVVRLRSAPGMLLCLPVLVPVQDRSRTGVCGQFGGLRRAPKPERDGGLPGASGDVPPSSLPLDRCPSLYAISSGRGLHLHYVASVHVARVLHHDHITSGGGRGPLGVSPILLPPTHQAFWMIMVISSAVYARSARTG
jgi:hypothetical protein